MGAWFLMGTHSIAIDKARALELSQKACDMGHCYSCANLSHMYRKGDGVAKDQTLAEKYMLKAKELHVEMTQSQRTITMNQ